jgi:type I restriction enzyme, S subunit
MVLLRPSAGKVHHRFLQYWLNSPLLASHVHGLRDGSVAERLNLPTIRGLLVPIPLLQTQEAIAHILGTLDDKIELNRRMNATVEEMARALFQSWFVDFDPVRAKAAGRQPAGMDSETAALFPSTLRPSEEGALPQGRQVSTIGNSVRVVGGSTPSTKNQEFWDGGELHWVTPKDLAGLSASILLNTERKITPAGLMQIGSGLLPVGAVLLSSRAPIGYLAVSQIPVAINQGFIAMVCDGLLGPYYVLHWARANLDLIKSRANGTTFKR